MPMEGLIPPVGPEGIGYWIPAVMQEASKRQSHLLFHSDKDGMYLPIEAMKMPILSSGPDLPVLGTCTPFCTSYNAVRGPIEEGLVLLCRSGQAAAGEDQVE